MQKIFKISGMNCVSCAKIIEYGLVEESGIKSVSVNSDSQKAFLEFDSSKTNVEKIKGLIKGLGYKAIEEN